MIGVFEGAHALLPKVKAGSGNAGFFGRLCRGTTKAQRYPKDVNQKWQRLLINPSETLPIGREHRTKNQARQKT